MVPYASITLDTISVTILCLDSNCYYGEDHGWYDMKLGL